MENIDTYNANFQEALKLVQYTHQSVFLTGKAGTGKSTFLRYICQNTKKKYVVLAPTGIAAINAGGSTLHSFFKLPFYPLLPDDPNLSVKNKRIYDFFKYRRDHRKVIEEVELIIIDEISMVRADTIDAIDRILRVFSHNMKIPFGGKQILLVGDVYQLEPVVKNDERELINRYYATPYFFSAKVFNEMELVSIELQKVYRQTDPIFINLLDHIRNNRINNGDLQLLNERYNAPIEESEQDMYITLASRKDTVDNINEKKLQELVGENMIFEGEINGDFPDANLPTPMELMLKVGAQIIFVKNDMERRWVNGTIGIVEGYDKEENILYVITDDGKHYDVRQEMWRNIRYTYDEKEKVIKEEELGNYLQFPLKLAWAITIHKSQGLTFPRVIIDLTGGAFAAGQTYVALSRCTSLDGISLNRTISQSDIFVRPEIVDFAKRFNNQQSINKAMKEAQADLQYIAASQAFDRGDMNECITQFLRAIHSRYDIERPPVTRLIRRKLNCINTMREQLKKMKEDLNDYHKEMASLAKEYIVMGDICINDAHDPKAALANYNKAIRLNPIAVEAYIKKGNILADTKKTEALSCFNKAISLAPAGYDAFFARGCFFLNLHDTERSIADLDKATSIKSDSVIAHDKFGDALMMAGREEEAGIQWELAKRLAKKQKKKK